MVLAQRTLYGKPSFICSYKCRSMLTEYLWALLADYFWIKFSVSVHIWEVNQRFSLNHTCKVLPGLKWPDSSNSDRQPLWQSRPIHYVGAKLMAWFLFILILLTLISHFPSGPSRFSEARGLSHTSNKVKGSKEPIISSPKFSNLFNNTDISPIIASKGGSASYSNTPPHHFIKVWI